jgi:hypothetical protein
VWPQSVDASLAAATQLNGDWLWIPQRLRFAPYAQDCAVQAWPLTHSELLAQSCAPVAPPGQAPPAATAWHDVVATVPFSTPQQTCPVGQSHCWWHPKVTESAPVHPVDLDGQLQVPWTCPPTKPVTVKQQSFERRSHVDVPQSGAVYGEQLPASPPELLEPPLEDEELPPEEEPPLEDDALPPDDELLLDEVLPPEEELLDDELVVASRTSTDASTMPEGAQYLPPRADATHASPLGHSALVAQSW